MANCYARCTGNDTERSKDAHRLGSRSALGYAQTWQTFAKAFVKADGSGYIEVTRNGRSITLAFKGVLAALKWVLEK